MDRLPQKDLQGFPGTPTEVGKKLPIVEKITAQDLWDAEDKMPVRNLLEDIHAEPFPELHDALLMTGRAEMAALAGKCQQIFMAAILAFHTGKAFVQIAAIEVPVNNLLQMGSPESVLPGEMIIIDQDKGFEIVLHTAVVIRSLRISWAINGGRKGHDLSPSRISCRHNVERSFYLSRRKQRLSPGSLASVDAHGDGIIKGRRPS
jgi:hypothetical protein